MHATSHEFFCNTQLNNGRKKEMLLLLTILTPVLTHFKWIVNLTLRQPKLQKVKTVTASKLYPLLQESDQIHNFLPSLNQI